MKDNIKNDVAAIVTTGLNLAVGFGSNLDPETISLIRSCSPIIQRTVARVLDVFSGRTISKIERNRIGICYDSFVKCVKENDEKGLKVNEEFFRNEVNYTKIDELFEAMTRASLDDYQTIKSVLYGRLLANALYQNKYNEDNLYMLLKTAQQLSIDEMYMIIALFGDPVRDYDCVVRYANEGNPVAIEMASNLTHCLSLGILKRMPYYSLGATLGNLQLSALGEHLYSMMELNTFNPLEAARFKLTLIAYFDLK